MSYKSQNNEVDVVLNYFNGFNGTLLDVGANDGVTFSNSYDLIRQGWCGTLIEPSSVFDKLINTYNGNKKVECLNVAIGVVRSEMTLYESGAHVKGGKDKALVSTLDVNETEKWAKSGVKFTERKVKVIPFSDILGCYEFITIDCEGFDWVVLQQIDLTKIGCKCLCIEWNGDSKLERLFTEYCDKFGLKEISRNRENLIFAR